MIFPLKPALIAAAMAVLPPAPQPATDTLPFAFPSVVAHFKESTGIKPMPLHPHCVIFALGEAYRKNDHVESVIIVTEDPPRLAVSFMVSGGYGMNFVSEFFEAKFFERAESENFYALLHGPKEHSLTTFPRFAVEFTRVDTAEWHFISLTFGPPAPPPPLP